MQCERIVIKVTLQDRMQTMQPRTYRIDEVVGDHCEGGSYESSKYALYQRESGDSSYWVLRPDAMKRLRFHLQKKIGGAFVLEELLYRDIEGDMVVMQDYDDLKSALETQNLCVSLRLTAVVSQAAHTASPNAPVLAETGPTAVSITKACTNALDEARDIQASTGLGSHGNIAAPGSQPKEHRISVDPSGMPQRPKAKTGPWLSAAKTPSKCNQVTTKRPAGLDVDPPKKLPRGTDSEQTATPVETRPAVIVKGNAGGGVHTRLPSEELMNRKSSKSSIHQKHDTTAAQEQGPEEVAGPSPRHDQQSCVVDRKHECSQHVIGRNMSSSVHLTAAQPRRKEQLEPHQTASTSQFISEPGDAKTSLASQAPALTQPKSGPLMPLHATALHSHEKSPVSSKHARTGSVNSPRGRFTTIQAAIECYPPHSRIQVPPGVYRECIVINKNGITLENSGASGKVVIENPDKTGILSTIVIAASDVALRNLTILGPSVVHKNESEVQDAVFVAANKSKIVIDSCDIKGKTALQYADLTNPRYLGNSGIKFDVESSGEVKGSTIQDFSLHGIVARLSSSVTVTSTKIRNCDMYGIFMVGSGRPGERLIFDSVEVTGCQTGFILECYPLTMRKCKANRNRGHGLATGLPYLDHKVRGYKQMPISRNGHVIYRELNKLDRQHYIHHCEFKDNQGSGLHVKLGGCVFITKSTITDNAETGIWFEDDPDDEDRSGMAQAVIDKNESSLVKNVICYNDEGLVIEGEQKVYGCPSTAEGVQHNTTRDIEGNLRDIGS